MSGVVRVDLLIVIEVRLSWLKEEKKGSNNGEAGGEHKAVLLVFLSLEDTKVCLWLTSWIRHDSEQYKFSSIQWRSQMIHQERSMLNKIWVFKQECLYALWNWQYNFENYVCRIKEKERKKREWTASKIQFIVPWKAWI